MSHRKLLLLGATGGTGLQILSQALEAGHDVTALVRNAAKVSVQHSRLNLVIGSAAGPAALDAAMRGQDAVISALGRGMSFKSQGLIQQCVPPMLSAMQAHGVRRLIFTSAIGVGAPTRDLPLFSRLMARFPLKDIYADKAAGEALIRRSDLDWTLVQPAQLTNGPLTGKYREGEHLKLSGMPKISRADTAHFIVRQLDDQTYVRKVVSLAY